jgi:hypothetical protein
MYFSYYHALGLLSRTGSSHPFSPNTGDYWQIGIGGKTERLLPEWDAMTVRFQT